MVVEVSAEDSLEDFCINGYQLAVFEYTEMFGGYWGPIPEAVIKQDPDDPVYTKQYTLATKPTPPVTRQKTETTFWTPNTTTSRSSVPTATTQDYITIDVPLVNLSATLFPIRVETQYQKPFDVDEFFDQFYDVVPRPGQLYKTSILPLVQIAVKQQEGLREGDGEPRYELDYEVGPFTPDHRLTTPARSIATQINKNRNNNRWKKKKLQDKRVEQKTYSPRARPIESRKFFRKEFSLPTTSLRPSKHVDKETEPFNLVDDVIKSLNESGSLKPHKPNDSHVFTIFNKWDNSYRNLSVYLDPYPNVTVIPFRKTTESVLGTVLSNDESQNSSETTRISSALAYNTNSYEKKQNDEHNSVKVETTTMEGITKSTVEMTTTFLPLSAESPETMKSITIGTSTNSSFETNVQGKLESSTHDVEDSSRLDLRRLENQGIQSSLAATRLLIDDIPIPVITTERSLSGTLVDHESWENVVQSAPVMAGLLNQHGPQLIKPRNKQWPHSLRRRRRRRHISAIMIDDARPHRRVTTSLPPMHASAFDANDVHEFARLMELPDDQMNNHVTIKMNTETNTPLFDMCTASNQSKTRFLVLFNSSRIILSIENFTMSHVMVALTTARPLAQLEPQCPGSLVECQVEGTRLCIDSTNSCDGIPNCGSAYAYDEDRVLCGVIDRQRSVYLAAATCLAVLVTMLYITHYWLRICVPQVAEAFFVYYDSADNKLYLDSIMRSPMDPDRDQYMYNSALFDEENMLYSHDVQRSSNIFHRMFSIFHKIHLFKQRRPSNKLEEEQGAGRSLSLEVRRNTSLTESELLSMMSDGRDQEVQTGESLEMAYLKVLNAKERESDKRQTRQRLPSVHDIVFRDYLNAQLSSSLDTSLESAGPSGRPTVLAPSSGLEEREIHSTLYDPGTRKDSKIDKKSSGGKRGKKCLRFNERATFIPREDEEGDEPEETEELSAGKRSHKGESSSDHGVSDFRNFFRKKKDHK
ncbi:uncharacterized protein LOC125240712 isoform X2 [Leguminivora glycinivorella]|nr:uncharacterized protein LOC125240712 isoform X2 [Leguminivora glycinivorella]